ncbi:C39 family peptidase [Sodalis ligni]|uniref:C39 family peptidase n=1 Tax=Sodalis ligni TaxID=2697027 RepID=UPI0019401D60|nr:C39 family peptidase [Sodalis ligni]QWA12216.1 C39 family peptidase [Sodalis ligni]
MPVEHYPYVSQWSAPGLNQRILAGADPCGDPDWREQSGFSDAQEYRFWSWRICGIACFQSLLLYRRRHGATPNPSLCSRYAIWRHAMAAKAYIPQPDGSVKGLIYAPFVAMIVRLYGISARVDTAISRESLADCLSRGMPVMASVSPKIRHADGYNSDPGANGGHLVLCYGLEGDRVWFNNPSATETAPYHSSLPLDAFFSWCAGRGVVFDAASCPAST